MNTPKNRTTEAIHQIPKEIRKRYGIKNHWRENKDKHIAVNNPSYINIDDDGHIQVVERSATWTIQNSKVSVSFWKDVFCMHTTVY